MNTFLQMRKIERLGNMAKVTEMAGDEIVYTSKMENHNYSLSAKYGLSFVSL